MANLRLIQDEKSCRICGLVLPIGEFYQHSQKKHLFHSACKTCSKEYSSQKKPWPAKPIPAEKACACCKEIFSVEHFGKKYSNKPYLNSWCKKCEKQKDAMYAKRVSKEARKRNSLKSIYGITIDDYLKMMQNQDGRCAICSVVFDMAASSRSNFYPNVDHCHKTGKIRGILCRCCNQGLGFFRDSEECLKRAMAYIKRGSSWQ